MEAPGETPAGEGKAAIVADGGYREEIVTQKHRPWALRAWMSLLGTMAVIAALGSFFAEHLLEVLFEGGLLVLVAEFAIACLLSIFEPPIMVTETISEPIGGDPRNGPDALY